MNVETFKICSRAFFPNCRFVDGYTDAYAFFGEGRNIKSFAMNSNYTSKHEDCGILNTYAREQVVGTNTKSFYEFCKNLKEVKNSYRR